MGQLYPLRTRLPPSIYIPLWDSPLPVLQTSLRGLSTGLSHHLSYTPQMSPYNTAHRLNHIVGYQYVTGPSNVSHLHRLNQVVATPLMRPLDHSLTSISTTLCGTSVGLLPPVI